MLRSFKNFQNSSIHLTILNSKKFFSKLPSSSTGPLKKPTVCGYPFSNIGLSTISTKTAWGLAPLVFSVDETAPNRKGIFFPRFPSLGKVTDPVHFLEIEFF